MNYDFEVGPDNWAHPQYEYRVIYHLGTLRSLPVWNGQTGKYDYPTNGEAELQERNYVKIVGYLEQMLASDQYIVDRSISIIHIYCNEWIDEAVLQLCCPTDRHFLKPGLVEHLNTELPTQEVLYAYS